MQKRRFGPFAAGRVPVIGLGTWQMEKDDRHRAVAAIHAAIEAGLTHIDTAEIYGKGLVEELVGEALAGYRSDVFLASKVNPPQATYAGTLRACEGSLRRLRTDRLDLYLLHWRGSQPLEETFRAFQTLRQEGKILAWGVSNFDVADLDRAIEIVGEGTIACNQVLYNLVERDAEHALQAYCERHEIAFVGYSPLGSGQFPPAGSARRLVLDRVAAGHNTTARAVALAYLTRGVGAFTIPKTASVDHVGELAAAGDLALSTDDIAAIEAAFPLAPPRTALPQA